MKKQQTGEQCWRRLASVENLRQREKERKRNEDEEKGPEKYFNI